MSITRGKFRRLSVDEHRQVAQHARGIESHVSAILGVMNHGGLVKEQRRVIRVSDLLRGILMDLEFRLYREHPETEAVNGSIY